MRLWMIVAWWIAIGVGIYWMFAPDIRIPVIWLVGGIAWLAVWRMRQKPKP